MGDFVSFLAENWAFWPKNRAKTTIFEQKTMVTNHAASRIFRGRFLELFL